MRRPISSLLSLATQAICLIALLSLSKAVTAQNVCMETTPYNTTEILQSDDVYDNLSKMDGVMFDVFVDTTSGTGVFVESFSFVVTAEYGDTDPMPGLNVYFALDRQSYKVGRDRRDWSLEYTVPMPHIVPGELYVMNLDLNYWVYSGDRQGVRIEFDSEHWTPNNQRPAVFVVPRDTQIAANSGVAVDGSFVAPGEVQILSGDALEFTAGNGLVRDRAFRGGLCYSEPPIDFDPQYGCVRTDRSGGADRTRPQFADDHGVMFDLDVSGGHAVEVVEVMVELGPDASSADAEGKVDGIQFWIYVTNDGGSFLGREADRSAWSRVGSRTLYGTNGDYPSIRLETPVRIENGSVQGVYITADDSATGLGALHTGSYFGESNQTVLGSDDHFGESGALQIRGGVGFSGVFVPNANREFRGQVCFKSDSVTLAPTPMPTTPTPTEAATTTAPPPPPTTTAPPPPPTPSPTTERVVDGGVDAGGADGGDEDGGGGLANNGGDSDASTDNPATIIGLPAWAGALTIVVLVAFACLLVGAVVLFVRRRKKQERYSHFEDPYAPHDQGPYNISEPHLIVSTKRPYIAPSSNIQRQLMEEDNL